MPIPQHKEALLSAIEITYQQLKAELESIPAEKANEKTLTGHVQNTNISVCNIVAYLIGWGTLVLKWHHKKQKNETVVFPEEGYKWNQLGLLAQKFYADYAHLDFIHLLKKLDETSKEIKGIIHQHNNEQLYETLWYNKHTLGRMIQLNTSSAYKNARIRIRKWKKQQGKLIN